MSLTETPDADPAAGKASAAVVYALYLLSLPSIGALTLVGVIWAYAARGQSAGWVRSHFDKEIRLFWQTLWWSIGVAVVGALTVLALGLGFFVWWAGGIVIAVWFHVVSLLGLLNLLGDRPA